MSKPKKQAKYRFQIGRCTAALATGKVLAIDPSSGSMRSLPGYALFENGKLVESGVIELKIGKELPRRLQELAKTLREEFEEVDVLVIEDILFTNTKNLRASSSLFKGIGCILGAAKYKQFVEIGPSSWKSYLKKNADQFPNYEKSDDFDAIVMGYMAIDIAKELGGSSS